MTDAVRELLRVKQEVFMPLIHRVGEAQVVKRAHCLPAPPRRRTSRRQQIFAETNAAPNVGGFYETIKVYLQKRCRNPSAS
jgi:hypothetical protein